MKRESVAALSLQFVLDVAWDKTMSVILRWPQFWPWASRKQLLPERKPDILWYYDKCNHFLSNYVHLFSLTFLASCLQIYTQFYQMWDKTIIAVAQNMFLKWIQFSLTLKSQTVDSLYLLQLAICELISSKEHDVGHRKKWNITHNTLTEIESGAAFKTKQKAEMSDSLQGKCNWLFESEFYVGNSGFSHSYVILVCKHTLFILSSIFTYL